ncbi:MAG: Aspartyl/glutamyl-tRNA(Asn/Gln) amidotransferase subunit C [Firmicutes bacterium ADurb.Bin193]|nr:MAG: Aspartyl/glutamyl-tRNA(Asn/Gln) amidotransferase subunit C [Firmicutes bacterium ADurb.Bin193]
MKITREDVEYVANLAHLKISEDEQDAFVSDMENIISFADILSGVDTGDVEPTFHALELENVLREDVVTNDYDRDDLLKNAPSKHNGCFEVPKVVE